MTQQFFQFHSSTVTPVALLVVVVVLVVELAVVHHYNAESRPTENRCAKR